MDCISLSLSLFLIAAKILHAVTKEKEMLWITAPQRCHGISNIDSPFHPGFATICRKTNQICNNFATRLYI